MKHECTAVSNAPKTSQTSKLEKTMLYRLQGVISLKCPWLPKIFDNLKKDLDNSNNNSIVLNILKTIIRNLYSNN